jgi:hypothetical protein
MRFQDNEGNSGERVHTIGEVHTITRVVHLMRAPRRLVCPLCRCVHLWAVSAMKQPVDFITHIALLTIPPAVPACACVHRGDLWVVGAQNAGKSSLISAMKRLGGTSGSREPTVAPVRVCSRSYSAVVFGSCSYSAFQKGHCGARHE